MGKRRSEKNPKSKTLPSSPSHSFSSSSSSDFEFTITLSPLKSSSNLLCPADELFYKGQLLPLHLSPRISMVRTLLLSSSSSSSSSSTRTSTDTSSSASRDSTGSSNSNDSFLFPNDCDSSRPSSVTEEDHEFKKLNLNFNHNPSTQIHHQIKKPKYFSLARISSVFRTKNRDQETTTVTESSAVPPVKKVSSSSSSAKEVIRKYLKKVKPLYEKLSQKQQQQKIDLNSKSGILKTVTEKSVTEISSTVVTNRVKENNNNGGFSSSFSGNLRYPRRRSIVSSCPSSVRSSPSHSGVLCRNNVIAGGGGNVFDSSTSSMKELQNAIQGAIAHCKNSMGGVQKEILVSSSTTSS